MSQYSTGELAKVVGVSVRTVQYYDQRGILIPSEVSDGGRRIYNDEDLQKLQVICFLRELDFSIEHIKKVLSEENADAVLELLLEDHVKELKEQVAEQRTKLDKAVNLLDQVKKDKDYSLAKLKDISITMKNQNLWRRLWFNMILGIILISVVYVGVIILGTTVLKSKVITFGAMPIFFIGLNLWIQHYLSKIEYLCPNCHQTFDANFKQVAVASHTPRTRKLTCPHCHEKSYCLELAKER
ncbi:MerR family transcriptional regulator [Streptococcus hillyeri]|uniref:MerR family transcriptional regulator n=1 Tax=Streptococcus hillyeri TaxID=2282420 RepID=A0A3L9DLH9_9STRE|nr:MerR family transcriptional regulator [Streptococcus hillyeri]RLY01604.1 MerR family transcriptional regulator [Streptococcus hillyeri]